MEVFLSGEWGTVTDDGAHDLATITVCLQLGYETSSKWLATIVTSNIFINVSIQVQHTIITQSLVKGQEKFT